jgi:hypothetical protein
LNVIRLDIVRCDHVGEYNALGHDLDHFLEDSLAHAVERLRVLHGLHGIVPVRIVDPPIGVSASVIRSVSFAKNHRVLGIP